MPKTDTDELSHPANAVFALMEDREFRFGVIRPALEKNKAGLAKLVTGKHQLKGYRHIAKAPMVMLVPVISSEANASPELAKSIIQSWLEDHGTLRKTIAEKLTSLGYTPKKLPFGEDDMISWKTLKDEHAQAQFDGTFLENEDKNAVMLMSLLLGWFGSDRGEETEEE